MSVLHRFIGHMDLMSRMFVKTGASGALGFPGGLEVPLKQASIRCAGCRADEACRQWLDAEADDTPPPSFCANSALIERLRQAY